MIPIITGVIGIITAVIIVFLIRRDHLHARYGLWWMTAASAFALLGLYPWVFDEIAIYLGVAYSPVLAMMLAIVILVLKILVMDIERSRNQVKLNRLVQRIGILEAELTRLDPPPGADQTNLHENDTPSPENDAGTLTE